MFILDESGSNIVKGDAASLKADGRYRFGVRIESPGNGGNWGMTVSSMRAFRDRSEIDKLLSTPGMAVISKLGKDNADKVISSITSNNI